MAGRTCCRRVRSAIRGAILAPKEVAALLRACSDRASTGMRTGALIVAMYEAGLRVWVALALRPSDVNRRTGSIRVAGRKGRGLRDVRLDPTPLGILERWLERREPWGWDRRHPLKGRPIELRVRRCGAARSVSERCRPGRTS